MSESQSASELTEELGRLDIKTTDDNEVYARVTDIEGVGDDVNVTVELVTGQTFTETFDKPIPWTREYKLVRLVEDQGYDASSLDNLVGEEILVRKEGDGWAIQNPGRVRVDIDKISIRMLQRVMVAGWVVAGAVSGYALNVDPIGILVVIVLSFLVSRTVAGLLDPLTS